MIENFEYTVLLGLLHWPPLVFAAWKRPLKPAPWSFRSLMMGPLIFLSCLTVLVCLMIFLDTRSSFIGGIPPAVGFVLYSVLTVGILPMLTVSAHILAGRFIGRLARKDRPGEIKLLPVTRFSLVSPLPPETLRRRVEMIFSPVDVNPLEDSRGRLQGVSRETGFEVTPTHTRFYNPFSPLMIGHYEPDVTGTRIRITQRLHHIVSVATGLGFLAFGFIFFGPITESAGAGQEDPIEAVGLFICIVLLAALIVVIRRSAAKARAHLKELFDAAEDDSEFALGSALPRMVA